MVLNKYRTSADKILTPVASAFSGLSPNTLSAASVIFALLAAVALVFADQSRLETQFKPGHYIYIMFIIASVCIFLNGFLDAVDGKVARLTNKMNKRGDFLDHALDRYADVLILGGIMLCPYCDPVIGALAIIAVLLTSYMGTQAQALGCGRNYSGLLGRADRMVILVMAPLVQMAVLYYYPTGKIPIMYIEGFTILEYVMLWFFIAGNITALHRGIQSWRELRDSEIPSQKERAKAFYERLSKEQQRAELKQGSMQKPSIETSKLPSKKRTKSKNVKKRQVRKAKPNKLDGYEIVWDNQSTNHKYKSRSKAKTRKIVAKKQVARPSSAAGLGVNRTKKRSKVKTARRWQN